MTFNNNMNYNVIYIEEMTAVAVLKDFNKVYAFGPEHETPFDVATTNVIRGFSCLALQILSFKKLFLNNPIFWEAKEIQSFKKYKQGLRRANREKAKHLISGNLEREGDNLTATADHGVVAHILKSIAEKNCFYFTCYISGLIKGLVMGISPLTPS